MALSLSGPCCSGAPGVILPHFGKVSFPNDIAEEIRDTLNPSEPQRFFQGLVYCRGVRLLSEDAGCIFEQLLIEHKIRTFQVFSIR